MQYFPVQVARDIRAVLDTMAEGDKFTDALELESRGEWVKLVNSFLSPSTPMECRQDIVDALILESNVSIVGLRADVCAGRTSADEAVAHLVHEEGGDDAILKHALDLFMSHALSGTPKSFREDCVAELLLRANRHRGSTFATPSVVRAAILRAAEERVYALARMIKPLTDVGVSGDTALTVVTQTVREITDSDVTGEADFAFASNFGATIF